MSKSLVAWSVDHPKRIILLTAIVTAIFLLQLPGMQKDTDPKHMLPAPPPSGSLTIRWRDGSSCIPI